MPDSVTPWSCLTVLHPGHAGQLYTWSCRTVVHLVMPGSCLIMLRTAPCSCLELHPVYDPLLQEPCLAEPCLAEPCSTKRRYENPYVKRAVEPCTAPLRHQGGRGGVQGGCTQGGTGVQGYPATTHSTTIITILVIMLRAPTKLALFGGLLTRRCQPGGTNPEVSTRRCPPQEVPTTVGGDFAKPRATNTCGISSVPTSTSCPNNGVRPVSGRPVSVGPCP